MNIIKISNPRFLCNCGILLIFLFYQFGFNAGVEGTHNELHNFRMNPRFESSGFATDYPQEAESFQNTPLPEWGYINILNDPYNAIADGVTDTTYAFSQAIKDVQNQGGGIIFVPTGKYLIEGHLKLGEGIQIVGANNHVWGSKTPQLTGTTLLAIAGAHNSSNEAFISMADNSAVIGLSIYYPNQVEKNPPIEYPACIQGHGASITIKDVNLVNPYFGIDVATYPCPRHLIQGVYGQPLNIGIKVDKTYDIGRISHVHFWPFWSLNEDVIQYQNDNAASFIFYRSDWEVVENIFSYGYHWGMYFGELENNGTNGQFSDINFDDVDIGIEVSVTLPYGIFFSNLNIASHGTSGNSIGILGKKGLGKSYIVVRGASFWGLMNQAILWENDGFISLTDSMIQMVDNKQKDWAIEIQSGTSMLRGLYYMPDALPSKKALWIGKDIEHSIIIGNYFGGHAYKNDADISISDLNDQR